MTISKKHYTINHSESDGTKTHTYTHDGTISSMVSGAFAGAAMSMSGNPMFCFVAGTTVLTTLGKKTIETIQVGDTIPCVDHITGESAEKRVITTTVNKVDRLIELDIDGEIIQCTETHPFQVKGRGWVDACDLNPGDIVYTKDWNTAVVKSVGLLELDEPVEVFNFEVEDCHTYFVGNLDLLVHNGPCSRRNAMRQAKRSENIPMSQKPDSIQIDKMIGENGRTVFAKTEIYGDKFIRNDLGGHLFKDGATLPKHFNAGVVEDLGNNVYKFISNGMHFFYG